MFRPQSGIDAASQRIQNVGTPTAAADATTKTYVDAAVRAVTVTNTQTASYTLVLADAGGVVEMNVSTANNLTVPLNATIAFPIGTVLEVFQLGAGQTTIVATGGVTLRTVNGLLIAAQYGSVSLRKRATDEWVVTGYTTT